MDIALRQTTEGDLPYVLSAERDQDNSRFVNIWSVDQHRAALSDENMAHMMIESAPDRRSIGFVILARIIHQPAKSTGEVDFVVQMSDNSTVSRWMRLLNLSCQVVLTPSTSVG
jgi:hypothetical protein